MQFRGHPPSPHPLPRDRHRHDPFVQKHISQSRLSGASNAGDSNPDRVIAALKVACVLPMPGDSSVLSPLAGVNSTSPGPWCSNQTIPNTVRGRFPRSSAPDADRQRSLTDLTCDFTRAGLPAEKARAQVVPSLKVRR